MFEPDSLGLESDTDDPGPGPPVGKIKFRKVGEHWEKVPLGPVDEEESDDDSDEQQIELVMLLQSDDEDDDGEKTEEPGDAGWEDQPQPTVGDILGEKQRG